MSAADLLREALEKAPKVTVEADGDDLDLYVDDNYVTTAATPKEERAFRLIGLLAASAPHLAALLDAPPGNGTPAFANARQRLVDAIAEAGESL